MELASRPGAREARAGRDTLKRTALVNTLLQTGRGEERGRLLGELLRQSREHLDPAKRMSESFLIPQDRDRLPLIRLLAELLVEEYLREQQEGGATISEPDGKQPT